MRHPLHALLWELWRTSRFELGIRIGGTCALTLMLRFASRDLGEIALLAIRGIAVAMILTFSVFSQTWLAALDNSSAGFSFRLGYIRPISTRMLVLTPMLFIAVSSGVCYLLPAVLFRWLMHTSIPLLGPTVVAGTAAICLASVTWSCPDRLTKILGLIGGCVIAFVLVRTMLVNGQEPILFTLGNAETFRLSWVHWLAMLVIAFAASQITVFSVDQQRHGGQFAFLSRRGTASSSVGRRKVQMPFSNPTVAQFWYEWRSFGYIVFALSFILPMLLVAFVTFLHLDRRWRFDTLLWTITIVTCPILYQAIGATGAIGLVVTQGNARLSKFDATRPMATDDLLIVKFLVVATCSFVGFVVMCAVAVTHASLTGSISDWARVGDVVTEFLARVHPIWLFAIFTDAVLLFFTSTWMVIGLGLFLPLYRYWFPLALVVTTSHALVLIVDAKNGWTYRSFWFWYAGLASIAIVLLGLWLIRKAVRARVMRPPLFAFAVSLWCIYVVSSVALQQKLASQSSIEIPLAIQALFASLLLGGIASYAIAPLALAAHRHR